MAVSYNKAQEEEKGEEKTESYNVMENDSTESRPAEESPRKPSLVKSCKY